MLEWWGSGCPDALSFRAWLIPLPVCLLLWAAAALSQPDSTSGPWVLAGLAGYLVLGLVLMLGSLIVSRLPHGRALASTGVWAIAGAMSVVVVGGIARLAGLPEQGSRLWAPLIGAALAALWLPVAGRFAYAVSADADARSALLGQLARERALALQSAALVSADRERVVDETARIVTEQLRKASAASASPGDAAAALQQVVDEVVKPLSKQLTRSEVEERSLVEATQAIGVVRSRPLADFRRALLHAPSYAVLGFIARIAVSLAVILGMAGWAVPSLPTLIAALALVLYTLTTSCLDVLATARNAETTRELSLAIDSAEWASSRLRQLAWSERERLGMSIHGDAQARIVSTALQIQLGQPENVAEHLLALEGEIRQLLSAPEATGDWRDTWDRILRVWEYSVSIDVTRTDEASRRLDSDPIAAHSVVSVLREAMTNSARHGEASSLRISLDVDTPRTIALVVIDNGRHSDRSPTPGLGTHTLDAACVSWGLESLETGHRLTARILTHGES